jgi:diguanylate cyclase (GGDEF)-like protein/PAS domain S-box-containing protein
MEMNRRTILVVEDSPEDRYSYRRMIEASGGDAYTVIEAEDATSGLALIQSVAIDCVVLDYNLPDMDGLAFLSRVGQGAGMRGVPVIFLTGQGNETVAVQAMKNGATDYLIKGRLTGDLLVRAIRHALETRDARQAVVEQNAFLSTLLETIPHPIFYRDIQGRYTGCNKAFEAFVGKQRNEIIGRVTADLFEVKGSQDYFDAETDLLRQPGTTTHEVALAIGNGTRHDVVVSKATFADAKGRIKGLVGVVMDITERKRMEAVLRQTSEQLQENFEKLGAANSRILEQQNAVIEEERLKVLLQMAGATAHELNQPLVSLLGYIDLFDFDKDDPAKLHSHLSKIKAAGHRIAEIVKKIQSIRPDQAKPSTAPSSVITLEQDIHLLAIEDSDEDFGRIASALRDQKRIRLTRARDFPEALEKLSHSPIDLIILDYLLPSGNGLDFLQMLEKNDLRTPVIFSTGHGDEMVAAKAIQAGAYDYLPKTKIDRDNLVRTIAHSLERHRLKTEVNQAMHKMADMSVRDELTGLYNRRYMNEVLDREYSRAKRYDHDLACLLIDMDFFKQVNDSFGHIFGDHVLKTFAGQLKENVRESDFCFRYGGEEFMVLLPSTDIVGANNTAEKLRNMVESHLFEDGQTSTHLTISIGSVSLKRHLPPDVRSMLAFADKALYSAKSEGRNRLKVYLDSSEETGAGQLAELDMVYFRERLSSILEKTRNASLNALALLLDQLGAIQFKEHHRKALEQIDVMGQKMRLPVKIIATIKRAAALHDHLKVLMPATVMGKKEPLDRFDRAYIENHSTMLAEVTRLFEFFRNEREILLYHQEHYDGSGYPSGLKGDQIPLGARIYAIADAVTAMLSERPYRTALNGEQVVEELLRNAGTQFDPRLVSVFVEALEDNPALRLSESYIEAQKKGAPLKRMPTPAS